MAELEVFTFRHINTNAHIHKSDQLGWFLRNGRRWSLASTYIHTCTFGLPYSCKTKGFQPVQGTAAGESHECRDYLTQWDCLTNEDKQQQGLRGQHGHSGKETGPWEDDGIWPGVGMGSQVSFILRQALTELLRLTLNFPAPSFSFSVAVALRVYH